MSTPEEIEEMIALANEELTILTRSRGFLRSRATRLINGIGQNVSALSQTVKFDNIEKLTFFKKELDDMNKAIFPLYIKTQVDDVDLRAKIFEEEKYDDEILACISALRSPPNASDQGDNTQNQSGFDPRNRLSLPKIPLPQFSNHETEDIQNFLKSFEYILEKQNLNSFEKFMYLRGQLSGSARAIIESIDMKDRSYESAKQLLIDAFDDKQKAKNTVIKRLVSLNLSSSNNSFSYIGEMKTVLNDIESNKITVADISQYFVWNSLDKKFQNHLTHITNKATPTLDDIKTNIWEANNRYIKENVNYSKDSSRSFEKKVKSKDTLEKENPKTVSMAIGVKQELICKLCQKSGKDSKHDFRKCINFDTPQKRIAQIKLLKGCCKCGWLNHQANKCTYTFNSNCRKCEGKHMSYLCIDDKKKPKGKTSANSVEVEEGNSSGESEVEEEQTVDISLSVVEALPAAQPESIVLPTFTVKLDENSAPIRAFRDTGCMKNFIRTDVANQFNLPVVKSNVELKISGFNSERKIKTKIVKVPILLNNSKYDIDAVCIDNINTKFVAKGIDKVVSKFESRGYKIADEELKHSNAVGNIKFILGAETDYVLPMNFIRYGNSEPSTYIETPVGVMFTGKLPKMIENLDYVIESKDTISFSCSDEIKHAVEEHSSLHDFSCENVIDDQLLFNKMHVMPPSEHDNPEETDTNLKLIDYIMESAERDDNGRMIMPILWNSKTCHLLSKNYHLAKSILP